MLGKAQHSSQVLLAVYFDLCREAHSASLHFWINRVFPQRRKFLAPLWEVLRDKDLPSETHSSSLNIFQIQTKDKSHTKQRIPFTNLVRGRCEASFSNYESFRLRPASHTKHSNLAFPYLDYPNFLAKLVTILFGRFQRTCNENLSQPSHGKIS